MDTKLDTILAESEHTQRKVGLFLINKLFPKGLIQSHINKNSSLNFETPLIFVLKYSELSI